jgi:hypothetical protein
LNKFLAQLPVFLQRLGFCSARIAKMAKDGTHFFLNSVVNIAQRRPGVKAPSVRFTELYYCVVLRSKTHSAVASAASPSAASGTSSEKASRMSV